MILRGQLYILQGNEPILLDDPSKVWVIQSGCIALFAVTVKDNVIEGTRRYLANIGAGEALFGTAVETRNFASLHGNQHRQILAVPIGETKLLQVHQECFSELVANADPRAIAWVEGWLRQISTALSLVPIPAIQVKADGQARFSLIKGQTFQPKSDLVCWVEIQQGSVHWLGFEELTLATAAKTFPLSDRMWLEAVEGVQLVTLATSEIRNPDTILAGFSLLHTQLLRWIDLLEYQEGQEELERLQAQERLNRQVTTEALGDLASALGSKEAVFFLEGAPLLVVAGAVGRAIGVTIHPPARSENLKRVKEPLEAIVRASRLRMRRVLLRDNWWEKDCGPLVAYTKQDNQPVALLPVSATAYEIFDPVDRTRIPVDARSASTLTNVAYMFYRSFADKVLTAVDVIQFTLWGRGRDLLIIVLTGIAATLLGMLTPQATAILLDNAIPDSDRGLLLQVGVGLLAAALGSAIFRLAQGFALLRVETASEASTQAAMWDRLLNLSVSFSRKYTTGDLLSRVLAIISLRRQLSGPTAINFMSGLFALCYLGLLVYYNWKLSLIPIVVALVAIALTAISGVFLVRNFHPMLELQGNITGQTVQLINGISKLRIAGAEERAFGAWSKKYSKQVKLENSTQRVQDGIIIFNTVMPTLTSALLFWYTSKLMNEAQTANSIGLSIGTFLAFNSGFGIFMRGVADLSNTVSGALRVVPQSKRLQPILETKPEVELSKADPGMLSGRIAVEHVTFRYRKDGLLTLDDVSIYAQQGEFIALVGGSGSGKSTIFRLLLGFETPETGSIYYDGQDLSGLDVDAVRRQLGVVLQNGRLMSASIFENIAGGAQITLDEAWEAARASGLADDITAMPMGMHTVISEGGSNISGGQRQRLLIARALVLKPRILLFDEATTALDNRTQAIVSESLDKLQVTRLVIAHRLSTIRNAHRIYVLQTGRIVQKGSFTELSAQPGLFVQLMARQTA